jgi:hypothetical protein
VTGVADVLCESCEKVPAAVLVIVEGAGGDRAGYRVCSACAADGVAAGARPVVTR